MNYADMHCDTVGILAQGRMAYLDRIDASVNLDKLQKGGCVAQFFALFTSLKTPYDPKRYEPVKPMLDRYFYLRNAFLRECVAFPDRLRQAFTVSEILENEKAGLISGVLTMEDGAPVERDLTNLARFREDGVRVCGLVWNHENQLAYPNSDDRETMNAPLKPFGREAVEEMYRLKIIPDVSHLNDGGFADVIKLYKRPFFATHSNARAVTHHRRNLTDEQLRCLGNAGGVAGLNFCSDFTSGRGDGVTRAEDLVRHLEHMVRLAGEDAVGFGSDFDGIDNAVFCGDAAGMPMLFREMEKRFSPRQMEKILKENVLRVLRENE